jgi:hypothetical protein
MEDPDITQLGKVFPNIKEDVFSFDRGDGIHVFYDIIIDEILCTRIRDAMTMEPFPVEFVIQIMKRDRGDHIVYVGEL